jgi:hypothetical protein
MRMSRSPVERDYPRYEISSDGWGPPWWVDMRSGTPPSIALARAFVAALERWKEGR